MRPSSTRLRFGGAIAATSLTVLVGLGGTAFAEAGGQGDEHRNERAGAADGTTDLTEDTDTNDGTPDDVVDGGDNAHPSGNDRSVEPGGSGNQGDAASEPDGNGHGPERDAGGVDQPNGPGGIDLADQDGNNGCGNDDDFEDDNEGLCGGRPDTVPETPPVDVDVDVVVDAGTVTPGVVLGSQLQNETPVAPAQVLGVAVERPAAAAAVDNAAIAATPAPVATAAVTPAPAAATTEVLGATAVRSGALARTGLGTGTMVLVALGLLLVGFAMVRRPKGVHFSA